MSDLDLSVLSDVYLRDLGLGIGASFLSELGLICLTSVCDLSLVSLLEFRFICLIILFLIERRFLSQFVVSWLRC